ncbi:Uncharacterised protein [Vibrio cholerae]|nr:Uncharacterised protein [Vibrio cholerae]CSA72337.1 Uncharacterised protein [Vibrio cholerae]CSB14996.1 Uncharacterised protein [Vibrio cholerae]CSB27471.1 Uncharacterised protein [Vibrio cholerae]CSB34961.1 Uncharacterised protein [Vibrio cholerae]
MQHRSISHIDHNIRVAEYATAERAQLRFDACQQLLVGKGLEHIIFRPRFEPFNPLLHFNFGGQYDHWQGFKHQPVRQMFQAVTIVQLPIQNHQIGTEPVLFDLLALRYPLACITMVMQIIAQTLAE